jgi:serine protease Do
LVNFSNSLADAVEAVGARVVRVEGRRRRPASGIIWDGGAVVTARHVVPPGAELRVATADGEARTARLVGEDPTTDVAVLEVDGLPSLPPPEGVLPRVGALGLAVARPGRALRADAGAVYASEGAWRTGAGAELAHYLEAAVTMFPGFSGGALAGVDGAIWGMLSSAFRPSRAVAVSTGSLLPLVSDLRRHGRVRRGYLGVTVQPAALGDPAAAAVGRGRGLLVSGVEPGSAAAAAGVMVGDILVELGGFALERPDDLLVALTGERVGAATPLGLVRGGQHITVDVTPTERPSAGRDD